MSAGHKVGIERLIAYCTHDQVGSALGRLRFEAADVLRPKLVQNLRCAPIESFLMVPGHLHVHVAGCDQGAVTHYTLNIAVNKLLAPYSLCDRSAKPTCQVGCDQNRGFGRVRPQRV